MKLICVATYRVVLYLESYAVIQSAAEITEHKASPITLHI